MSDSSKDKACTPNQARPAHPQATWPMPAAMADFGQWQQQMFWAQQWPAAMTYHPAYQQMYMQQAAASVTAPPPAAAQPSPRSKDDSVKVVKPKDPFVRGIHSPAGIQSPKPNSPGFLLGAGKGVGGRAFSVYTSRSETPGGAVSSASQGSLETGVDLTQKSLNRKSQAATTPTPSAADKDKKDDRPVGVAVARQRSAADSKSQTDTTDSVVVSTSTSAETSTTVTTSTTTSQTATPSTVNSQWPTFPPSLPYMANPYQHYAIAAQPAMYMMPTHRPMFPGHTGVAPGYIPVTPQQMMMSELTVKTSQAQAKAHASTSPNKPVSASTSPKSPLDKAREKLNEINQRKGSCSRQPSPSNSETKSVSSESTEKTAESTEAKPYHKSVIMTNNQALRSNGAPVAKLQIPPTKKERKEKEARVKQAAINKSIGKSSPSSAHRHGSANNTKLSSPDKGPKFKSRKSAAMSPSDADAAISALETLPADPKPLIAPAKFKPEARLSMDGDTTSTVTEPLAALKRSLSLDKPKSRRSRDSTELPGSSLSTPIKGDSNTSIFSVPSSSSSSLVESPRGRVKYRRAASSAASDVELVEYAKSGRSASAAVKSKQSRARGQKRASTDSASLTQASSTSVAAPAIPVDVHNKEYIWAENAFDPIIVKHNQQVYDICEDEDLKQLETKLKQRLKVVNKQIQTHEKYLKADSSAAFPLLLQSISASESRDCPLSPDKLKSNFSVRSDSHPSLKMKAAAKAKSRASKDEKEPEAPTSPPLKSPVTKATKSKPMTSLAPITIPEHELDCRRLTQEELLSTDGLILTCIEGLFYESRIKPIDPPDLYGVAIDGERHSSKPRIFTEEELLNHTYTNRTPTSMSQLFIGSRVCAYWSDMISHLYPGKVTEFYPAKNSHAKDLIDIEFDDGDSGKFPLYQIRLLPQDLPHIDYDTSNVIPGGRRRRCAVPETPPIMTTPPNRSRMSRSSISVDTENPPPPAKKKRGEKTPEKAPEKAKESKEPEIFDESTDEEHMEVEGKSGWKWVGPCTKKPTRGRGIRLEYQSATKDGETISLGNFVEICPPKLSETPYIAEIQNLWCKSNGEMNVTVKWFYHPEELEVKNVSLPKHKGALFRTEHSDTILVESVKQKCEVHSHEVYVKKKLHLRTAAEKKRNDQFYIAGIYDPANKVLTTRYY